MSLAYRADIDGLRAVAVGSVVLFHAGIPPFSGGFVGVDVFFVISGYLITSILRRDLEEGSFSFADFYDRRIRRIFPALFLVLAVTTVLAALVLLPSDMRTYAQSLIPAALFYANIFFLNLLSYFGPTAEETPLLHLWSLAVEEQFYIIFPLLLFGLMRIGGRRVALLALTAIAGLSLAHAQMSLASAHDVAFYLLSSRAWELLAGALLALMVVPRLPGRVADAIALAGVLAIVIPVFAYDRNTPFPGFGALPPVLGAAAVIFAGAAAHGGIVARLLALRGFVAVGRISYSLYLWHWPLLVLAFIYRGRDLTHLQAGGVVLLAVALSALSLRYVETPLRRPGLFGGWRLARMGAAAAVILLAVGASLGIERIGGAFFTLSPRAVAAEAAAGDRSRFQKECTTKPDSWVSPHFKPVADCAIGAKAASGSYDVLVWGDSHSGAAFAGLGELVESLGYTARLQSMPACPPLVGGEIRQTQIPDAACVEFNAAVMDEIATVKPKLVILVGRWSLWTTRAGASLALVSDEVPGGAVRSRETSQRVFAHMVERTAQEVLRHGSNVLVLGEVPEFRQAPGRCVARSEYFGGDAGACMEQPRDAALSVVGPANSVLEETMAGRPGRFVYLLSDIFCRDGTCRAGENGTFYYGDSNHLSATGASHIRHDASLRAAVAAALHGTQAPPTASVSLDE